MWHVENVNDLKYSEVKVPVPVLYHNLFHWIHSNMQVQYRRDAMMAFNGKIAWM